MNPKIAIIVARAQDYGIGCSDGLPWSIPEELKYFKNKTMGKPVIMGRKTFQSIIDQYGSPLPGRDNIVISRSGYEHPATKNFSSLTDAIEYAKNVAILSGLSEIFVIGGEEIFKQALKISDIIYLTEIKGQFKPANAFLQEEFFPNDFELISVQKRILSENFSKTEVACEFKVLERRTEFSI